MMAALEGETRLLGGLDGERRQQTISLIHSILPEVESVLTAHDIDCDFRRGGGIFAAARYPEQERLQRESLKSYQAISMGEGNYR